MDVTIAICTWNRARSLDRTLETVCALERPAELQFEVVVVDNGSTDATPEVIRRHAERLPIRAALEPIQGVSHARNCAVRHARAEWMVWTDDDTLVESDWLVAYLAAFEAHPEAGFFGGPILPHFEIDPPRWVVEAMPRLASVFSMRQLGDEPFAFETGDLPYGANFAARTELLRTHPFDPRIGRHAGGLLSGEESTVLEAILAEGHAGWWVPTARVHHVIPAARLTARYVRAAAYGLGQTDEILGLRPLPTASRSRIRLQALESEARWRILGWARPSERWVKHLMRSSYLWGRLAGDRRPGAVP
jgi:glycosyltransferase involved in cell wall biosynthesis